MEFWKNVKNEWTKPISLIGASALLNMAIIWFGRDNRWVLVLSLLLLCYLLSAYYLINKKEN